MSELSVEKIREYETPMGGILIRGKNYSTQHVIQFLLSHIEEIERDTARRCRDGSAAINATLGEYGEVTAEALRVDVGDMRSAIRETIREFNLDGGE